MIETPAVVSVPLRTDQEGVIRIGDTRVTLTTLIGFHKQDYTAEQLHSSFPVVPLADIYAVLAYYMANTEEVDEYIRRMDEEGERIRREWEAEHPPVLTRAILEARLEAKRKQSHE